MSSALLRLAEQVMAEYAIPYRSVALVHSAEGKAIWKIFGRDRVYGLKRLKYGKDQTLFAVQAQKYMQDRGGPVPSIVQTRKSGLYAERNGQLFILYEWINGSKPVFSDSSDLRIAVQTLARLHKASVGFRPETACRESSKMGKWPAQYQTMEQHFRLWQTDSAFPKLSSVVKPYWKSMIRLAGQARSDLSSSAYADLTAKDVRMLCHQDYSEGNVLLNRSGGTVIDLDSVTYDFPARDLRKLILKRMQVREQWDSALFDKIMNWYRADYPLSAEQLRLVRIDLSFPHLFHETAKNPFRNHTAVPASKLLGAVRIETEKESALANWPARG